MTLAEVTPRNEVVVVTIDNGRGVRSHLNTLGIHIGDVMTVVDRAPFGGPVLVEVHGSRVAIGRGLARMIEVGSHGATRSLADPQ
jgi:ferrous iron transport protein A